MPRPVDLSSNLRDVEKNGAKKKEKKKKQVISTVWQYSSS